MEQLSYAQALRNLGWHLLAYSPLYTCPSLFVGGFGKVVAFLVFLSLLTFVVLHSAEIRRVAIAVFEALRLPLLALVVKSSPLERRQTFTALPGMPSLSSLFQRPPPIFSI
jgi:hypothetical protein